jgi:hypothetical protein
LYRGIRFKYGSLEELIAIKEFDRLRTIELSSTVFSSGGPGAGKVFNQLLTSIYPEERTRNYDFFMKSSESLRKIKGAELKIYPVENVPKQYKGDKK